MTNKNIAKILIIAGSDPCGGAGLQADIKTATAHKVYCGAVVTCLTAQNTQGVASVFNVPIKFLKAQLETVLDDIKFDVIKIGMLSNAEIIDCVADVLLHKAKKIPLILDTVMVSTSGHRLLEKNAVSALKSRLLKGAFLATPNIDEAEILAQMPIKNLADMKIAAIKIKALGVKNVLIKGGHLPAKNSLIQNILLADKSCQANNTKAAGQDTFFTISNKKIAIKNIHGTGCSLASAIACNIAKKIDLPKSVKKANNYVYKAVVNNLSVGKGSKVLQHFV